MKDMTLSYRLNRGEIDGCKTIHIGQALAYVMFETIGLYHIVAEINSSHV